MKKIISFFLAAIVVLGMQMAVSADTEAVSEKAEKALEASGAVSIQYALSDGGKITVSGHAGVYSKTENRALTPDIMYGIGSTSKIYTTAAVMKLVDEKKVDLDTPVKTYLPEFEMADERYQRITVRMLLNHSSGLMGSTLGNAFLFDDNDDILHDTFLESLKRQRLKAEPGAYSVYCNDGFTLAELLVEQVSGMDFTTFLHQNFFEPLQLVNTKTPQDTFDKKQLARLYSSMDKSKELPADVVNAIATGGIYSTAEDICRFAQIFTGEKPLLSEESVRAMTEKEYENGIWPKAERNTFGYGLGWDSVNLYPFSEYGITALTKAGDTQLSHSSVVVIPEYHLVAAVTSSGGSSSVDQMLANHLLLEALKEKGIISELKPELSVEASEKVPYEKNPSEYEGLYGDSSKLLTVSISEEGMLTLAMALAPSVQEKYYYIGNGMFESSDSETYRTRISFEKADNGITYIRTEAVATVANFGQTAATMYSFQKLPENMLPDEVKQAWQQRNGKHYFPLTEKYTSQVYYPSMPVAGIAISEQGYLGANRIIDASRANAVVQIPGMTGRDLTDYRFYNEDSTEYLDGAGSLFISQDGIKPIYAGGDAVCTIQPNGYARWYQIGEDAKGKTISVQVPQDAGFMVYDKKGICVMNTVLMDSEKTTLPEGGYLVFVGKIGAQFHITMQ